ncbi:MAG: hypothetical protein ACRDRT_13130, partial [Pseudonocardiaceae bacterium]
SLATSMPMMGAVCMITSCCCTVVALGWHTNVTLRDMAGRVRDKPGLPWDSSWTCAVWVGDFSQCLSAARRQ